MKHITTRAVVIRGGDRRVRCAETSPTDDVGADLRGLGVGQRRRARRPAQAQHPHLEAELRAPVSAPRAPHQRATEPRVLRREQLTHTSIITERIKSEEININ